MVTRQRAGNLMFFVSEAPAAELHSWRAQRYLGDLVDWIFYTTSPEEFVQVTSDSSGDWSVLLVDVEIAQLHPELIERFARLNPSARVGLLAVAPAVLPTAAAIALPPPATLNEWLETMYALIGGPAESVPAQRVT